MPIPYSRKVFSAFILIIFISFSACASADDHGKGSGKYKSKEYSKHQSQNVIVIDNSDRSVIRQYIADDYKAHCPPGLAKKRNGCLPPGQAKKRYVVGQYLPEDIVWLPVPQPLLIKLRPVPVGYQYIMVDKDVLLISEASKKIIDAVTLMSAVGN